MSIFHVRRKTHGILRRNERIVHGRHFYIAMKECIAEDLDQSSELVGASRGIKTYDTANAAKSVDSSFDNHFHRFNMPRK